MKVEEFHLVVTFYERTICSNEFKHVRIYIPTELIQLCYKYYRPLPFIFDLYNPYHIDIINNKDTQYQTIRYNSSHYCNGIFSTHKIQLNQTIKIIIKKAFNWFAFGYIDKIIANYTTGMYTNIYMFYVIA